MHEDQKPLQRVFQYLNVCAQHKSGDIHMLEVFSYSSCLSRPQSIKYIYEETSLLQTAITFAPA